MKLTENEKLQFDELIDSITYQTVALIESNVQFYEDEKITNTRRILLVGLMERLTESIKKEKYQYNMLEDL